MELKTLKVPTEVLGRRIKESRMALNYSLQKVADLTGVQNSTIFRYETGAIAKPKIPVVEAIASALETDVNYLLGCGPFEYWGKILTDLGGFIGALQYDPSSFCIYSIDADNPESTGVDDLRSYISDRIQSIEYADETKTWRVRYKPEAPENKKVPDTFVDVEELSEDKRYLVEKIMSLSDEEVRGLRAIVDQVLALRG